MTVYNIVIVINRLVNHSEMRRWSFKQVKFKHRQNRTLLQIEDDSRDMADILKYITKILPDDIDSLNISNKRTLH